MVHIFSNYVCLSDTTNTVFSARLWIFLSDFETVLILLPNEHAVHFFQLNKATALLFQAEWVCVVWECMQVCVCVTTCVFWYTSICIWLFLPWEATKRNSVTLWWENRLDYKIPSTCANWVLESLIWHLLEYYVICKWSVHQNKNPSPYFAALSLPSPMLQVCNVWAQFLGEFPICLCACYLWQRTVPGQQL